VAVAVVFQAQPTLGVAAVAAHRAPVQGPQGVPG
jgi:hypothetical protein